MSSVDDAAHPARMRVARIGAWGRGRDGRVTPDSVWGRGRETGRREFIGPDEIDVPLTFEGTREIGASLGSGVIMVFGDEANMTDILLRVAEFFRDESCGQCVPCRVGTVRVEEALHRIAKNGHQNGEVELIDELAQVMKDASICGLGHTAASAVQSALSRNLLAPKDQA